MPEPVATAPSAMPPPPALAPRRAWRRASTRRSGLGPVGWAGVALLGLLALGAIGAPWLAPYDPRATVGLPFAPPSAAHWLGTNDIGQDILSELLWGARISLLIGLLAASIGIAIGASVGAIAGYFRGQVDAVLMRTADVALVIPFLPLMIVLAAYVGPNVATLALVIGLLVWARPARVVRAAIVSQASRDHVLAARALGAGHRRILGLHLLPSVTAIVIAEFVQLASRAILLEAALAFLGLGDPTQKSWGTVLFYAQARGAFLSGAWVWWVLPAGLLIAAAVFGCALLGFDLERIANPRLRSR